MPTYTSFLEIRRKFDQLFSKLFYFKIWKNYYICLCRGAAVTTGLAYAQWFVDSAVVSVLITYFTEKKYNLPTAVTTVNVLDGLSSILVLAMTYISENHVSRLKVILLSNAAYITGMVMLCISAFHDMTFVPVVLLLIAVGKSGGLPILERFLVDQLTAHEPRQDIDEGRVNARKNVWWITASLLCKLSTLWIFGNAGWRVTFICSTSVMGIGYLLFLGCIPLYHRSVDDAAAANTDLERAAGWEGDTFFTASDPPPMDDSSKSTEKDQDCSTVNEEREGEEGEEGEGEGGFCPFMKDIEACWDYNAPILRAEKATEEDSIRELEKEKDKESASNNCLAATVCAGRNLVGQWKPLSVMIPMWTTFLVFGLVLSIGDTFFTEQGNKMDPTVSIYLVIMIGKIIKATSSFFTAILLKFVPRPQQTQGNIIGIWTAMVLSVFCCSIAWRFEIRRLRAIEEFDFCRKFKQDEYNTVIPMSILRLAPQFCLLGLMEGIGKQGLELFFEAQVPDVPMDKYGSALNDAVVGFGNFLNGLLVFCIKSWFGDNLNCTSHLDRYYQMLTILSFVNICYYWFVSTLYWDKKETRDDVEGNQRRCRRKPRNGNKTTGGIVLGRREKEQLGGKGTQ